ncbi:MAG TPA: glycosyltransferase family 2 protein [Chloroflexota bacterium]|nr:glycosyltransferase family 2 protein [Chloroflexota bacterium]
MSGDGAGTPRVGVVIVTYNSARVLGPCLESLRAQEPAVALTTVVVDNGSVDGTPELARARFPEVRLIEAPRNGGFSYGTNIGLRALGLLDGPSAASAPLCDYVLFLNADTELPAGALGELVGLLARRPEIGAVSPRLVRLDGALDQACRRGFPTPWNALCHLLGLDRRWPHSRRFGRYNLTYLPEDQPAAVDAVAGAFMLLPAAAVRQVGAWDEEYFAYGEDIDYCLRLHRAGWTVWYEPSVTVLHLKGAISQQRSLRMIAEFYRAMRVYYRKHQAGGHPLAVRLLITAGIYLFQALALLRQRLRAPGARWVGAARPVAGVAAPPPEQS